MAIAGKNGSVSGLNGATGIKNWDMDDAVEALDATTLESGGAKEFIEGLTEWAGSFLAIGARPTKGAAAAAEFNTGAHALTGAIIITNVGNEVDVAGVVGFPCTYQGNGQLSLA